MTVKEILARLMTSSRLTAHERDAVRMAHAHLPFGAANYEPAGSPADPGPFYREDVEQAAAPPQRRTAKRRGSAGAESTPWRQQRHVIPKGQRA